jgi:hypothetical protein
MDYFLLGHIKALSYMLPVDSEEALIARIIKAAATIGQQPGIFECTHQSLLHRFGCVSKSVAVHLNFCSKLLQNTTFLQGT